MIPPSLKVSRFRIGDREFVVDPPFEYEPVVTWRCRELEMISGKASLSEEDLMDHFSNVWRWFVESPKCSNYGKALADKLMARVREVK